MRVRSLVMASVLAACIQGPTTPPRPDGGAPIVANARGTRPDAVIPAPAREVFGAKADAFVIRADTKILCEPDALDVGRMLAGWLGVATANVAALDPRGALPDDVVVLSHHGFAPSETDERYALRVSTRRIEIESPSARGLFYGAETMAILAMARPLATVTAKPPPHRVPGVTVTDGPKFAFRAMHLDVARHFFDKATVLRWIDLLAFYKLNVFHWHLTDDQGFRLELPSHPELAAIGGKRTEPDGSIHRGSFSPADVAEVLAYAKARFIEVIPEIQMPGHARAILAAHPELSCTGKKQEVPNGWGVFDDVLCAGNEATYALLDDVIADVARMFPSKYIHVGGDEVPKTRWNACPKCRAKMEKEHLDAEHLQGAFGHRVAAMLAKHGKLPMVWDEALEGGLPEGAIVVAWQNEKRAGEVAAKWPAVIAAPHETTYLNFWQIRDQGGPGHTGLVTPWGKVLAFDARAQATTDAERTHLRGGEGTLWTEYVKTPAELDLLAHPRMAALASALWCEHPDPGDFIGRFGASLPLLDAAGVQYFVEPPLGLAKKRVFLESAPLDLRPPFVFPDAVVRYTVDGNDPTPIADLARGVRFWETTDVKARTFLANRRTSAVVSGRFEKQVPRPAVSPAPASVVQGVKYTYVEADGFEKLPDFAKATPKKTGTLATVSFDPSFRAEQFAVMYEGYLVMPDTGVLHLRARADDGVAVDIDGETVLEDDSAHAARDADGEIALAAGLHRFRLRYFQGRGGKALALSCSEGSAPCVLVR